MHWYQSIHSPYPFVETDDGPEGAAERAAAAEAAAEEPFGADRHRLLEHAVDTVDGGAVLLGRHLGRQRRRKLGTEPVVEAEPVVKYAYLASRLAMSPLTTSTYLWESRKNHENTISTCTHVRVRSNTTCTCTRAGPVARSVERWTP